MDHQTSLLVVVLDLLFSPVDALLLQVLINGLFHDGGDAHKIFFGIFWRACFIRGSSFMDMTIFMLFFYTLSFSPGQQLA